MRIKLDKKKILEMHKVGFLPVDIAKAMDVSVRTVQRVLKEGGK